VVEHAGDQIRSDPVHFLQRTRNETHTVPHTREGERGRTLLPLGAQTLHPCERFVDSLGLPPRHSAIQSVGEEKRREEKRTKSSPGTVSQPSPGS